MNKVSRNLIRLFENINIFRVLKTRIHFALVTAEEKARITEEVVLRIGILLECIVLCHALGTDVGLIK